MKLNQIHENFFFFGKYYLHLLNIQMLLKEFKGCSYETLIMVRSHIMKQNADFQEGISQA